MKKNIIPGTTGYSALVQPFIEATLAIPFDILHRDFLPFLPAETSRVLDIGAGIGRDAAELAWMGHSVTAIEPLDEFREAGEKLFADTRISWLADTLPHLTTVGTSQFAFILASGVWHHLDEADQVSAMKRVAELLEQDGTFALSLRHGPAGGGTHIFPCNAGSVLQHAADNGLHPLLLLEQQPSLMKNKEQVSWSRIIFRKKEA